MPRKTIPSASVTISQSTSPRRLRSYFMASDAMPKVKLLVRSTSVSVNADPILNSCAGPGAPAVEPSIRPDRSRTRTAQRPLHRSSGSPRAKYTFSTRAAAIAVLQGGSGPDDDLRHDHAIHADKPSFSVVSSTDEGTGCEDDSLHPAILGQIRFSTSRPTRSDRRPASGATGQTGQEHSAHADHHEPPDVPDQPERADAAADADDG